MRRQELGKGQVIPTAQGVSTFVDPARKSAAAPAQLQMLPNPGNTTIIQQGSGGSVQGSNQYAELANALQPFNQRLGQLVEGGLGMYAKGQYERGQAEAKAENEARRAQVLANQQQLKSGAEWSAEARKIGGKDPEASILMDRINPYRRAGRINALSRLAAGEIGAAVVSEYRATPGAVLLKEGDPQLSEIKARATAKVLSKYGLDDTTAGFVDYVAPEIAQAWDKVSNQHQIDRTNYLKDTLPRTAASEILGAYGQALQSGRVEWQEFNPATGAATTKSATRDADPEGFRRGLLVKFTAAIDRMGEEEGIRGNITELTQRVLDSLSTSAASLGQAELFDLLQQVGVGPPDRDGKRTAAGVFFGKDFLQARLQGMNFAAAVRADVERQRTDRAEEMQSELAQATLGMDDGPEKMAAANAVLDKYRIPVIGPDGKPMPGTELSAMDLMEGADKAMALGQKFTARGQSADDVEAWLQQQETAPSAGWNTTQKSQEFNRLVQSAPEADRPGLRRRFAAIAGKQDEENTKWPGALADPIVNSKITANIRAQYPKTASEASLRGGDPLAVISGMADSNAAESINRQRAAYRTHVLNRLAEAEQKKGRALTASEITATTQQAVNEYGSKDKGALKQLFPGGLEGGPAVGKAKPQPPTSVQLQQVKPPPGRKAADRQGWQSSQLDNIPNREKALRDGQPVLDRPSVEDEIERMARGDQASPAVRRAAKELGITPGKFVMQQADFYPSLQIPPAQRNRLLRSSREEAAVSRQIARMNAVDAVSTAGNWMLNLISGSAPAQAGTMSGQRIAWRGGGRDANAPFPTMDSGVGPPIGPRFAGDHGGLASLVSSGEGGWNSVNYGTTMSGGTMQLTSKSVGEIERMQSAGQVFAVGAYQFTPGVLTKARKAAGLSASAPMSPSNQTKMFWGLILKSDKRPALRDYLSGRSNDINAAHEDLAAEWAAVQRPNGRGRYDGDKAGNRASLPAARVRQALMQARRALRGSA